MQVTASDSLEFAAAVVAFLSVGVRSNNQLDPVSVVGVKSCVTQGCQKSCEILTTNTDRGQSSFPFLFFPVGEEVVLRRVWLSEDNLYIVVDIVIILHLYFFVCI